MSFGRALVCFLKWTIIIGLCVFAIHIWLNSKNYLFSEESVAKITKKFIEKKDKGSEFDIKEAYNKVHSEFQRQYPGHILPKEDLQWIFMNAGGWMGAMCLVHASLTEYVLFFGTVVETEGHSGRYWANITDTILTGEFHQWEEGHLKVNVFKPGDTAYHPIGEVTAVNFKDNTWMVEYGRGFVPSTLTFALADTFFSTTDFVTLFYILRIYAKSMLLEAGYYLAHMNEIFL